MRLTYFTVTTICLVQASLAQGRPAVKRPPVVVWADTPALERRTDVVRAAERLAREIHRRHLLPHTRLDCLAYELEDLRDGHFDFAIRFNEPKCGGDSPSNLIDRARVVPSESKVLWSNPAGEYVPFEQREE